MSECKHQDRYSRWLYSGDLLKSAAGFCSDCDVGHCLDIVNKEWNFKDKDGNTWKENYIECSLSTTEKGE